MSHRTTSRLVLSLATLALLTAACGGAEDPQVASLQSEEPALAAGDLEAGSDPTTTTASLDPEEAMLAFTQCMRDNGVDMADPEIDADGNLRLARPEGIEESGRDEIRGAREVCGPLLDDVVQQFRNVDRTELQDTLLAYTQCMRDNGYADMPDPDFSSFGPGARSPGGGGPLGGIDPEDPDFQAADEVCREQFAGFGRLGGRPGPGGRP